MARQNEHVSICNMDKLKPAFDPINACPMGNWYQSEYIQPNSLVHQKMLYMQW